MLIESIIRRAKGTNAEIEGVVYKFRPRGSGENPPHVCEVANLRHAQRFISIVEGYRIYDNNAPDPALRKPPQRKKVPTPAVEVDDTQTHPVSADTQEEPPAESTSLPSRNLDDLREELFAKTEIELITEYGRASKHALKIDRRMRKDNMVSVIIERVYS